jgi:hypothetical protein
MVPDQSIAVPGVRQPGQRPLIATHWVVPCHVICPATLLLWRHKKMPPLLRSVHFGRINDANSHLIAKLSLSVAPFQRVIGLGDQAGDAEIL